jgi:YfiR/HmsC-like
LFLPREEKPVRVRAWLNNAKNSPTLLVSNHTGFLDRGGMIALVYDNDSLHFEIDVAVTKSVGIKLSAQLLKIAQTVKGE